MSRAVCATGAATAAGRRGAPAEDGGGFASPRAVTRGESPAAVQRAKVDWLNATFAKPSMSVEGFVGFLSRLLGRPVSAVEAGGMLGFESRVELWAHIGSRRAPMGCIAFGGESQNGRWLLQLTGAGCGLVPDWAGVRELLEGLGARITRLDLAVDFLEGERSVDDAVAMWEEGGFTCGGRAPSTSVAGDWHERHDGRTFYVGKAKNGKMLRVYEKGKQLGEPESEWVRFEVQLGNRDRTIPMEALTDCDRFFAGCYPALESILGFAGETIATHVKGGTVTLSHLMYHLRRCYGKVLDVASAVCGAPDAELLEEVRIVGLPRRLNPSGIAAGLTWAQLHAQLRGR